MADEVKNTEEKTAPKKKSKKDKELENKQDLLLRTAAEFDNYKKRTEKEKIYTAEYAKASVLKTLLPILDNAERANGFETGTEQYNKFVDAVKETDVFKEWLAKRTKLNPKENSLEVLIATARQDIMDNRGGDASVDVGGAMAELVADFVGDCLFKDNGSGLEALVSSIDVKDRPAFIQYVLDFLAYLKKKLKGNKEISFEISHLEDSFNRMLSEATQVKSQSQKNDFEDIKFTFARVTDESLIKQAEQMEKEGAIRSKIWRKHRIIRDAAGEWVYEISDDGMIFCPDGDAVIENEPDYYEYVDLKKLKRKTKEQRSRFLELKEKYRNVRHGNEKLEDYIIHDKLFKKFPFLRDINFRTEYMYRASGYYDHANNTMVIDKHLIEPITDKSISETDRNIMESAKEVELYKTLIHEMQHAIQFHENREQGANIEYWANRALSGNIPLNKKGKPMTPDEAYFYTAGEIESRETGKRQLWTDKDRAKAMPNLGWKKAVFASKGYTPVHSDADYMKAVNSGNTEVVQSMVDDTAEAAGYTERLYHQTGADFTEFNTENQSAGKYDWELPAGTFLKPSDSDIGLKGKKQMELYAKLQNPLEFKDRQEAQAFWKKNIDGYSEAVIAIEKVDDEYTAKYSEAEGDVRRYMLSWKHDNPQASRRDIYSDSEFIRLHEREQQVLEEWESASDEASLAAKELINDYISRNDYDGIIIEKDQDGDNVSTKSYIVFESSQLKDAAAVTYDDNGEVVPLSQRFDTEKKDIRFSMPRKSVGGTQKKIAFKRNSLYNEYATNVMQWANSASTKTDDIKVFNDRGKEFVLNMATEDGYIELARGNYEEVRELEQLYNAENEGFDRYAETYKSIERTSDSNLWEPPNRKMFGQNSRTVDKTQDGVEGNTTTENAEYVRSSDKREHLKDKADSRESAFSMPKFSIPQSTKTLLDKYDNGEISREEMVEQLDGLWGAANEKYGSIEKGENAQTPLSVPKQVSENKFTERFVRTFIETGKLTPEMIEDVEREILLGDTYSYKPVSDEAAQNKADRYFEKGMAEDTWNEAVNTRAVNKYDIAVGEKLLLQAIESNDRLRVIELSSELADVLTRAGQTVQAARMLKKMSGIGRLVTRQREVKTLNKSLEEKYGDKAPTIKINPLQAKQLAEAKTQKEIDMVDGEIMQDIANQVPPTFIDKWNAWRYWSMLSNPKTHIRNLVGNAIFTPAVRIKDVMATGMESIAITINKMDNSDRTKSLIVQEEYRDFAIADGKKDEVKQLLKGNKYNDKTALKEKQRIFKNNVLEFITRFNSNALEAEDMLFKNKHYIHALAGYLQARKIDVKNISEDALTEARIYAVNEAIKATFNDESALANWVQDFGNKNMFTNILVEGVLPFKRTPINIVKRGIEYSPLGLMKTLTKGVYDVKKGKITPTEFIDGLASGLTGTGIMVAGMILANLGCVSGGEDDDKLSDFEKWLGKQEYAVEFAGKSYTIDWGAPACIPFFIGVEIIDTMSAGEDFQLSKVSNAIWNSLEPITNLSMLSGMQGVIESTRYAESSQTLAAIVGDAVTSYAMQGIPSLAGAVSRTIDPTQRSWYTDKNDKVFDSFSQSVINNVKSKVPGLSYFQIPKIDPWGREVSRGGVGERVLENFVSPGYYSEIEYTDTNEELKRLFVKTGENVLPKIAPKSFQVNGITKQLTADEYVIYAKARGEYSFEYINELINTGKYQKLTDEEKAEVITNLYSFANAKAKTEVSDYDLLGEGSKYKTVTKWERNGKSAADYYIHNVISK